MKHEWNYSKEEKYRRHQYFARYFASSIKNNTSELKEDSKEKCEIISIDTVTIKKKNTKTFKVINRFFFWKSTPQEPTDFTRYIKIYHKKNYS